MARIEWGRFRTEGKIHLPEGQPEVWNYEKDLRSVQQWLME